MNLNLSEKSDAYYINNDYYELFSICEDAKGLVKDYLKENAKDKIVLDAGCGSGKYLSVLEDASISYTGVDLAPNQLEIAKKKIKKNNSKLIVSDLSEIDFKDESFDLIVSCWVLGCIDKEKRDLALTKLKRLLKPNGKIILIENDSVGEFEILRNHDKDGKTIEYNNYLLDNGFIIDKRFNTYFEFKTKDEAKECFKVIYGENISDKINSNIIEHKIISFVYKK